MLMLVSLQNSELNQITFYFDFFLVYLSDYDWCHLRWQVHGYVFASTGDVLNNYIPS